MGISKLSLPSNLEEAFAQIKPPLDDVARYVGDTLARYSEGKGFLFRERTKELESLSEKLESGRFNKWSEVDDLYACTIVVPLHAQKEDVLCFLKERFVEKVVKSSTSTEKSPEVFRFDGTRWYGRLSGDAASQRQPGVGSITFEVQVVTAFEHAWSWVTHSLLYKSDQVEWRQLRLGAHLKAAVEQVEVLIAAFEAASEGVQASPWKETDHKARIVDAFKSLIDDGKIPGLVEPASWRRFADNVYGLIRSYTRDSSRLEAAVETLIDEVEGALDEGDESTVARAGTLFQFVLNVVYQRIGKTALRKFPVVPSDVLKTVYGIDDFPREFSFDVLDAEPEGAVHSLGGLKHDGRTYLAQGDDRQ